MFTLVFEIFAQTKNYNCWCIYITISYTSLIMFYMPVASFLLLCTVVWFFFLQFVCSMCCAVAQRQRQCYQGSRMLLSELCCGACERVVCSVCGSYAVAVCSAPCGGFASFYSLEIKFNLTSQEWLFRVCINCMCYTITIQDNEFPAYRKKNISSIRFMIHEPLTLNWLKSV